MYTSPTFEIGKDGNVVRINADYQGACDTRAIFIHARDGDRVARGNTITNVSPTFQIYTNLCRYKKIQ